MRIFTWIFIVMLLSYPLELRSQFKLKGIQGQVDTTYLFSNELIENFIKQKPKLLTIALGKAKYALSLQPVQMFHDNLKLLDSYGNTLYLPNNIHFFNGFVVSNQTEKVSLAIYKNNIFALIDHIDSTIILTPDGFNGRHKVQMSNKHGMDKYICPHEPNTTPRIRSSNRNSDSPICRTIDLAIGVESSMVDHHGGPLEALIHLAMIVNAMQVNYDTDAFKIQFKISHCYFSMSSNTDWETDANNDARDLLFDFRDWGNAGGFGNTNYDIAWLWTRRNLSFIIDGTPNFSVLGFANKCACHPSRCNVLEENTANMDRLRVLAGHELAHTLDASHDDASVPNIMESTLNSSANRFSFRSKTEIKNFITSNAANCIESCVEESCVPYSNVDQSNGNFKTSSLITTNPSLSLNGNMSLDAPNVVFYTDFEVPTSRQLTVLVEGCD